MLKIYNTPTQQKEDFKPIKDKKVGIYSCGPTVYSYAHIGNLRSYIFADILKRTLEYDGYKAKHVINITDVGHLTSDADTGEDKMEIGAQRERKTAWEIAKFYTKAFKKDIKKLNIKSPSVWTKATDYIKEQIDLIKVLESKGFAYKLSDGIYFDTSKIKDYGKMANLENQDLKSGARVEAVEGKKNITDFALWKFTAPGVKRQMEWDSPWGKGFPGWHTECVAMSAKNLGVPFDIHTGGIDHVPIHHTNEIAQSEAAFDKPLANYWMHNEFLILDGEKMAKSDGNILTVNKLIEKGSNPLAYRYLCLTANYGSKINFSWDGLQAAQNAFDNLCQKIIEIKSDKQKIKSDESKIKNYKDKFKELINNDLDTPQALALDWEIIKDTTISPKDKYKLLLDFDKIFGLNIKKIKETKIPQNIKNLVQKREAARAKKDWQESDELREEIKKLGWWVEDTKDGPIIKKL